MDHRGPRLAATAWLVAWPIFLRFAGNAAPPDADMATLGTMARWLAAGETASSVSSVAGVPMVIRYPASGAFLTAFVANVAGLQMHEAALVLWAATPFLVVAAILALRRAIVPTRSLSGVDFALVIATAYFAVLHDMHTLGAFPRLLAWALGVIALAELREPRPYDAAVAGLLLVGGGALQPAASASFVLPVAVILVARARGWRSAEWMAAGAVALVAIGVFVPLVMRVQVGDNRLLMEPPSFERNVSPLLPWLVIAVVMAVGIVRLTQRRLAAAVLLTWCATSWVVTWQAAAAVGSTAAPAAAGVIVMIAVLLDPSNRRWTATAAAALLAAGFQSTTIIGFTSGFPLISLRDARFLSLHAGTIPPRARMLAVQPLDDSDWARFGFPINQWWVSSFADVRAVDWRINEQHVRRGTAGPTVAQYACHRAAWLVPSRAACDWSLIDAVFVGSRNTGHEVSLPPSFKLQASDSHGLQLYVPTAD